MEQTLFYRNNIDELPPIPLPFYAYGTGISRVPSHQAEEKKGGMNQFVELMWGVEGIGELELYGRSFQFKSGDVFYYLPGESHLLRPFCDNWSVRWLCFDGPLAEAFLLSFRYPRHQHTDAPYPQWLFKELERNIGDTDPLQIRRMSAVVHEIVAYAGGQDAQGARSELFARRCTQFISANLGDPQLGVDMLCDEFSLARSTLTKLFTEQIGCSPGRYIMDHRMARGMTLLRNTHLPVKEIAKRCGFAEARSFSRFIRRGNQVSPLELRRQERAVNRLHDGPDCCKADNSSIPSGL